MRTVKLLVMVAALAVAGSALAQHHTATAPKDNAHDPLAAPFYHVVVKELNLSADKQAELREKLEAKSEAMEAWNKSKKGQELADMNKKLEAARKDNNKDEVKKLEADIKPLKEDRAKVEADEDAKIDAFWTADQKPVVAAVEAYLAAMRKFSKADLTADQKTKTMTIAKEYGNKFVAAKDKSETEKVRKEFYTKVDENVLTAEQRAEMKAKHDKGAQTKPAK